MDEGIYHVSKVPQESKKYFLSIKKISNLDTQRRQV